MVCPRQLINVKNVASCWLNAMVKMVYSGVAAITPTALPVIMTMTTGPSFDFFSTQNTQENSCRADGYRLRFSLCLGGRDLATTLHSGDP